MQLGTPSQFVFVKFKDYAFFVPKDSSGRVAIVEFKPEKFSHSTARETIDEEMGAAGFRLVKAFDYLERQHFLVYAAETLDPEEAVR